MVTTPAATSNGHPYDTAVLGVSQCHSSLPVFRLHHALLECWLCVFVCFSSAPREEDGSGVQSLLGLRDTPFIFQRETPRNSVPKSRLPVL